MSNLKNKLGSSLKENVSLADYATFKIGGPAKYFFAAKNNEDLVKAIRAALADGLNYFILGGGSNILVSDQGFDGLVIKQENRNFKIDGEKIYTESGALVSTLLDQTLAAGLVGWSWAAGLPGTIGGAVAGNAGAYGESMADIFINGEVFQDGQIKNYSKEQMQFSYRHSIIKETKAIILSVTMELKTGDVAKEKELISSYLKRRKETQPLELPNSGCVFKNIDLNQTQIDKEKVIKGLDINEQQYNEVTKHNKLPISFIFDKLGLKGKTIGGAQVSEKHAAFIVNTGKAKAEHVIMLISDLKMRARNELGVQLQEEIKYIGF